MHAALVDRGLATVAGMNDPRVPCPLPDDLERAVQRVREVMRRERRIR